MPCPIKLTRIRYSVVRGKPRWAPKSAYDRPVGFLANDFKHINGFFEGASAARERSYHLFPSGGTNRSAQKKRRFPQIN